MPERGVVPIGLWIQSVDGGGLRASSLALKEEPTPPPSTMEVKRLSSRAGPAVAIFQMPLAPMRYYHFNRLHDLLRGRFVAFLYGRAEEYLITTDQPIKSIESAAMRGMVPDAILARRERSGFPVPVREWLAELAPWVEITVAEVERFPFLEPHCVRQTWESVQSRNKSVADAFLVWRWIFLAGWVRYCSVSLD